MTASEVASPTAWRYAPEPKALSAPPVLDAEPVRRAPRVLSPDESFALAPPLLRRIAIIAAVLYALILFDVSFGGLVARLDGWSSLTLSGMPSALVWIGGLVSLIAETLLLIIILAGVAFYLALRDLRRDATVLAVSAVGLAAVIALAKLSVQRMRPILPEAHAGFPAALQPSSLSFPSGHAAMAVLAWGLILVALLARPVPGREWRVPRRLVWTWIAIALVAGVARLIFGVHWPGDVLAGWALGLAWLAATLAVWQNLVSELPDGEDGEAEGHASAANTAPRADGPPKF